jgi:hypothetical protein
MRVIKRVPTSDADDVLLTEKELATRWGVTPKMLQKWRTEGGPLPYVKLGKSRTSPVRYRLSDALVFERENLFGNTSQYPAKPQCGVPTPATR